MPILDRQKKSYQIGEIRIGAEVDAKDKKGNPIKRPAKLDAFRFTTQSLHAAIALAEHFGGDVHPAVLKNGKKTYEVFSHANELPVMVPPGDAVISQWYELWSAAGCQRRCDGYTEQRTGEDCLCPSDLAVRAEKAKSGSACRPTTRLSVMLPDIPDLGIWLLTSGGGNAADELEDKAKMLRAARASGVILPATLRLEQREVRIVGEKPRQFAVPVLEIGKSLREIAAIGSGQDLKAQLVESTEQQTAQPALGTGMPVAHQQDDDETIDAELVDDHDDTHGLDAEHAAELQRRIEAASSSSAWAKVAAKQIERWTAELKADQDQGAPF